MRITWLHITVVVSSATFGLTAETSVAAELPITELLSDVRYSTACGPISCFVAAHYFGHNNVSLDEMAKSCNWSEGKTTTLQEIAGAIESIPELQAQGVRLSPNQLVELLGSREYAAILTVRRDSNHVNHAVCVFGNENGEVSSVDYPSLRQTWSISRLADEWDGKALLISRRPETHWIVFGLQSTLPGIAIASVIFMATFGFRKSISDQ